MKTNLRNFITKASLFSCILLIASCSSSKKLTEGIDTTFDTFPAFKTGFSGLLVFDPTTGQVVYEQSADKYFTPASNTKLLTFYTGLKILGDSAPALEYTTRNDSLFFRGTGDPSFLFKKVDSSRVVNFLKNRKEELIYVPPIYKEKHFGPGWAWDDYNYYYSVERAAMPLYGNHAEITFLPEKATPNVKPEFFKQFLRKGSTANGKYSRVIRHRFKNEFVYHHGTGTKKGVREVPFIHTPGTLVQLLSDTLNKPVGLIQPEKINWKDSKVLHSIPMDGLYKRMLQVSDNFIAEQILLMSSKVISDTLKSDIAIDYMKEHHLQDLPDEPVWVDGSGLSVYNKFTPRTMVKLLQKIAEEVPQERLFHLLPAGGESGTIKDLYKAHQPYIFAKTGTLSNVHALSGFLKTKSKKVLIFSFMNNNYTVPSAEIKSGMEKILQNIHLNH